MSHNNLYKGFEVELFTGSLNSHIGVSAEIEKKFPNFVKEPVKSSTSKPLKRFILLIYLSKLANALKIPLALLIVS